LELIVETIGGAVKVELSWREEPGWLLGGGLNVLLGLLLLGISLVLEVEPMVLLLLRVVLRDGSGVILGLLVVLGLGSSGRAQVLVLVAIWPVLVGMLVDLRAVLTIVIGSGGLVGGWIGLLRDGVVLWGWVVLGNGRGPGLIMSGGSRRWVKRSRGLGQVITGNLESVLSSSVSDGDLLPIRAQV